MTQNEENTMLEAMRAYGGGFAAALAVAWQRADSGNRAKLAAAFPELVERYGPGSAFFNTCAIDRHHRANA